MHRPHQILNFFSPRKSPPCNKYFFSDKRISTENSEGARCWVWRRAFRRRQRLRFLAKKCSPQGWQISRPQLSLFISVTCYFVVSFTYQQIKPKQYHQHFLFAAECCEDSMLPVSVWKGRSTNRTDFPTLPRILLISNKCISLIVGCFHLSRLPRCFFFPRHWLVECHRPLCCPVLSCAVFEFSLKFN